MLILDSFDTIDISQSADKALQIRTDRKFVINLTLLPQILSEVKGDYHCQIINGLKISKYESNYYDTIDFQSYNYTRIKRPNRLKIRRRLYHNGNLSFLEIKRKVKGNKTVKMRTPSTDTIDDEQSRQFLLDYHIDSTSLTHVIDVFYNRFTLISNCDTERVTIDTGIHYEFNGNRKSLNNLAIIEIKQEKLTNSSKLFRVLSSMGVRQMSVSKYCVGMSLMYDSINTKGFNKKLNKVKELINS